MNDIRNKPKKSNILNNKLPSNQYIHICVDRMNRYDESDRMPIFYTSI